MTSDTTQPERLGAVDAVLTSVSDAWNRMTWMLFRGPQASIATWAWWGLILLLSGATNLGSGGGGSNVSDNGGDLSELTGFAAPTIAVGWISMLIASLACVGLVVFIVWLYVRSRFRFVAVDGIMSGEPRIRDVWPRTSAVGMQYFIFELLVAIACLVIALPVILSWIPVIAAASSGTEPGVASIALPIVITLAIVIPLVIAKSLLDWFIYDITLPLVWLVEQDFWAGLRRSMRLFRENLGAILVFLLGRVMVGIVGGLAFGCAACLTCVLWIWPALAAAGLIIVSLPFPPVLIVTAPLAIAFGIVTGWIIMTAGAPLFVFYRAWSVAFVGRLDPDLPRFDLPSALPPAAGPPAAPSGPETAGGSWGAPPPAGENAGDPGPPGSIPDGGGPPSGPGG